MNRGQVEQRLAAWAEALAAWRIPDEIMASATESPWVLPTQVFSRRAERNVTAPSGPSYEHARDALGDGGSVLDIGAGGGAASLALADRTTHLTAVDSEVRMLDDLAHRACGLGLSPRLVHGTWPAVAPDTPPVDVVLCHHVLYNVPELGPFLTELTSHARRLVVAELTEAHPLTGLNAYWKHFYGLDRPSSPTADDALGILRGFGYEVTVDRWRRPPSAEYASFEELVDVTRRRLCLPPSRASEVAEVLTAQGVSPGSPPDLGSSGRDLVTLCWPGASREAI